MPRSPDKPIDPSASADAADYARIEAAIAFLCERRDVQPTLNELALHIGLSASRIQRLFSRWAGISPKRFVQFLTVEHVKRRMAETTDLLSLALDAGLSGAGRLHDLFVNLEAMSPGEYRRAAAGLTIRFGIGPTPFGAAEVAITERGVCHMSFVDAVGSRAIDHRLRAHWPGARLVRDDDAASALLARVFAGPPDPGAGLSLWVSGTNFQIQVWRALLRVPFAGLLSYSELARLMGRPGAARAVGTAMARNPIAFLIPCHRVLRESGRFGTYHWGGARKVAICAWESANREQAQGQLDIC